MCRCKALSWYVAIWQLEVALLNSIRSGVCDKNGEQLQHSESSPSGLGHSVVVPLRIAGKCKRHKPKFGGKCYPSTTGQRVKVKDHGWCCLCPIRATWNPGTKECVCEGAAVNGLQRLLPDEKTRKCPTSTEEIGWAVAREGYDPAMSQVKSIQDYCKGRRTLEEFIPGSSTNAQNFIMRMGLSENTAIAIERIKFKHFTATMSLSETSSGMSLTISRSVIHISLEGISVVYGNFFVQVSQANIKARVFGIESVSRLAKFGVPLNIKVKLLEPIQIGDMIIDRHRFSVKMKHWHQKIFDTARGLFLETIEQKVINKLVANICSTLAFTMRGVALDSTLTAALQGHSPWPLNIRVKLCDRTMAEAFKHRRVGATCLEVDIEAGEVNPDDTSAILEENGFASLEVKVNLHTGFQGSEFHLKVDNDLQVDFASILRSFAEDANEVVIDIALGNQPEGAETILEEDNQILSCHDPKAPKTWLGSAGRWVAGAVATGTSKTFGLAAYIAGGAYMGAYNVFDSAWNWARGTSYLEIPTEVGTERATFELGIFLNWQEEARNQDRVGILLPDRDANRSNPDFYIAGLRSVEINLEGALQAEVRDDLGTLQLIGELQLPRVRVSGLVYDILDKKRKEGYMWKSHYVNDWELSLVDVSASVLVQISKSDGISACARIPVNRLGLDAQFAAYNIIAKAGMWFKGAKLKAFVGKAIESTIVSLLETALASAPNAMEAARFTLKVENIGASLHIAEVNVEALSDWTHLSTLQAHFAAIPPEAAASDQVELDEDDASGLMSPFAMNASVEFGRGWNDLPQKWSSLERPPFRRAPDVTAEKLSFEPEVWLNQDLYKSLDLLIPAMNLGGKLDMSVSRAHQALAVFQGFVWADIDAVLRSGLNDHGGWMYGDFQASNLYKLMAQKFEPKTKEVTSTREYHAVLSCGALYLLAAHKAPNRLRHEDTANPEWTEKGGVFDILDGLLKNMRQECNSNAFTHEKRPKMPGSGGTLFEGEDPAHKRKFWICIPKSSPMREAVLWEHDRAQAMRLMMKQEGYSSFTDWSPVSWPYKNSPFAWLPDKAKQRVEDDCKAEVDACAKFMGCMGVAINPCTFLSSREVVGRTGTFIRKKWQVGLP